MNFLSKNKKKTIAITLLIIALVLAFSPIEKHYTEYVKVPHSDLTRQNMFPNLKAYEYSENPFPRLWEEEAASLSSNPTIDTLTATGEDQTYHNLLHGYELTLPEKWTVDHNQSDIYARFFQKNFRIDLTYQHLDWAYTSWEDFQKTTLAPVQEDVTKSENWSTDEYDFHLHTYNREHIPGIPNDMTHYTYLFVVKNREVFTFQLKTTEEYIDSLTDELKAVAASLTTTEKVKFDLLSEVDLKKSIPIDYVHKKNTLSIPENHFSMGIYIDPSNEVKVLEEEFGLHFSSQMFYKGVNSTYDEYVSTLAERKQTPIITFLFEDTTTEDNSHIIRNIIRGDYDKNFTDWAAGIKKTKSPVFLRLGNEMNGSWADWSHVNNHNDPDLYKLAFQRIVDIFKHHETDNAYFVWNPNGRSSPLYTWNDSRMYYPGNEHVDWVGMTAYNFGTTDTTEFTYFKDLYTPLYEQYSRLYPSKPLMIGEFASADSGGSKAHFIEHLFEGMPTDFPNLKMAVWFNKVHDPYNFRFTEDEEARNAFKEGLNKEYIIDGLQ